MRKLSLIGAGMTAALWLSLMSAIATKAQVSAEHYHQTNLISDQPGAIHQDPYLVNPWGLARSSGGPWWVADNGAGLSSVYDGQGNLINPPLVTVPPANVMSASGTPTGVVYNGGTAFQIGRFLPAIFIFVTEDGTISGWNPSVNASHAVVKVNGKDNPVFKGATIATDNLSGTLQVSQLYVADFHSGRIRVYNTEFQEVPLGASQFHDATLPAGYAPFNIQNVSGNLVVTYALQDSNQHDQVNGIGLGYVDIYSVHGKLLLRLQHGVWFNAPWGVAEAPSDFGEYSHDLLVGQFGSGEILAFNPLTGSYLGKLMEVTDKPIQIPGLWALQFGNGSTAGALNLLYFSAGTNNEADGLFGTINGIENPQGNDQ